VSATAERTDVFAGYSDEERPLAGYAALIATFGLGFAGFLLALARSEKDFPQRVRFDDLLLTAVATQKLSRTIAKDKVTGALRAPFTRYQGSAGPGEVDEAPRGHGLRRALGELFSCPFCVSQWVAAGFSYGLVLWPRPTRFVAGLMTATALADALQLAYKALEEHATS
jgi:hypothetical protein